MRRAAGLWRHQVLGVSLGVLVIVFTPLTLMIAYTVATRGVFLHPPDSRYYLTMTSRDMGHPVTDSISRTREVVGWHLAPWYFAGNEPTWQMVKTRALYPFLSVPFVWIAGLRNGTMYVPCASLFAFCWITARVLQRLYGPAVAALIATGFGLTTTLTGPGLVWATTDTLALALSAVLVANLPIERRVGPVNLVWLGVAGTALALTRQVGVLAPAMAAFGWAWALVRERTWRNPWLAPMAVTVIVTGGTQLALGTVAHVDTQGIVTRDQTTFGGVVQQLLKNIGTVTKGDLGYMWDKDRLLYVLLGAALLMALVRFTKDLAATFWGALASTYVLTAGVGYSAGMRYEIIMFPAAAVAAGSFAAWALGQVGSPFPAVREPEVEPDLGRALWVPQLAGSLVVLGVCVAVTAAGGSRSTTPTPATPSFLAAQGGQPYAVQPLTKPGAEAPLKAALDQALGILSKKNKTLEGPFDWVHDLKYRVSGPGDPNYRRRAADGTTITRINAMTDPEQTAFSQTITFEGSVEPDTLQIDSRHTTAFGEDVDFSVWDSAGVRHHGTATTLYPIWDAADPGLVTAIVYAR